MSDWSIRRLDFAKGLNNATRYLEIGVLQGGTFLPFECQHKDAVDPEFQFDLSAHAGQGVRYFEQTSDAFFEDPARDTEEPYDLVFIDGLHTYEQTLRDFLNVLPRTHEKSIIVIDDTVPNDVFSAGTDYKRVVTHRKRLNLKSTTWHGDVYKLIFFINDFMPFLSFATLMGAGNPQTVVWRERRPDFKPLFNNTETISRLSYFDMFERRRQMNCVKEAVGHAQMAKAFGIDLHAED